jgi:hypothetical protein
MQCYPDSLGTFIFSAYSNSEEIQASALSLRVWERQCTGMSRDGTSHLFNPLPSANKTQYMILSRTTSLKTIGECGWNVRAFLTPALDVGKWLASRSSFFYTWRKGFLTHGINDVVNSRADMGIGRKELMLLTGNGPRLSTVASEFTDWASPAYIYIYI